MKNSSILSKSNHIWAFDIWGGNEKLFIQSGKIYSKNRTLNNENKFLSLKSAEADQRWINSIEKVSFLWYMYLENRFFSKTCFNEIKFKFKNKIKNFYEFFLYKYNHCYRASTIHEFLCQDKSFSKRSPRFQIGNIWFPFDMRNFWLCRV